MPRLGRHHGNGYVGLLLSGSLLLLGPNPPATPAEETIPAGSYSPIVPAPAIHAALHANLKQVRSWLDEKDYASAFQAANGLAALAHIYGYQSTQPSWAEKIAHLREAGTRLLAAAKSKDRVGCEKCAGDFDNLLADLAAAPPSGARVVEKSFRPYGSTKTWMLLLEGAYVDAKTARSAQELDQLASLLVEGSNITLHLRSDARWREMSVSTRDAASQVAEKARANDLTGAKAVLKTVYQRCEACHQGYKR